MKRVREKKNKEILSTSLSIYGFINSQNCFDSKSISYLGTKGIIHPVNDHTLYCSFLTVHIVCYT